MFDCTLYWILFNIKPCIAKKMYKSYLFILKLNVFNYEEFEDSKVVIRIRKSTNDRQHNGQKKNYKSSNNDLQNLTQWATWTPLKTRGELKCSGRVNNSCFTSCPRRVTLVTNPVISHELTIVQLVHCNK
jgi:hypothetical protein